MAWTLAHNLKVRMAAVDAVWPTMTVFSIGDQAHQAECSDHNPDARGIVHAIDIMTETDADFDGAAAVILTWLLSSTADLQYVIHDRKIYSRTTGFAARDYTGTDPHTNHIHVSGRHGSTGTNAATCTGYDVAAEGMTPEGIHMALTAGDAKLVVATLKADPSYVDLTWRVEAIADALDQFANGSMKGNPVALTALLKAIPTTAAPAASVDVDAIATKVADLLAARLES